MRSLNGGADRKGSLACEHWPYLFGSLSTAARPRFRDSEISRARPWFDSCKNRSPLPLAALPAPDTVVELPSHSGRNINHSGAAGTIAGCLPGRVEVREDKQLREC